MHYAIKTYVNKQIVKMADENLSDYSCLSRYHYTKSKKYLKKDKIPMFIVTPLKWWSIFRIEPNISLQVPQLIKVFVLSESKSWLYI